MKVKSISYSKYEGHVYNFHCEPDENYYVKNSLVHNCYKANTPTGDYMSLETFKTVLDRLNENDQLTQVALGADADCSLNPDIWKIMDYCRSKRIIPNITVADVDPDTAEKLKERCGAVAVSYHSNWEAFTETVYNLTTQFEGGLPGLTQCNVHFMIAQETIPDLFELYHRFKTDPRLAKIHAIVLLSLKKCGRSKSGPFTQLTQKLFEDIIYESMQNEIPLGFDSCSAHSFLRAIDSINELNGIEYKEKIDNVAQLRELAEPCESLLQSAYVNTHGIAYPCSFNETTGLPGFDVTNCKSYITEYWNNMNAADGWRWKLLKAKRECPTYAIRL